MNDKKQAKEYTPQQIAEMEALLHSWAAEIEQKTHRVNELESQNDYLRTRDEMLQKVLASRTWRLAQGLGSLFKKNKQIQNDVSQNQLSVPQGIVLSADKKTVFIIDEFIPAYDRDAGSRTLHDYILLLLAKGYGVVILPQSGAYSEYAGLYESMGVPVLWGEWYAANWQAWAMENSGAFAAIWLNRPHVATQYIDFFKEKMAAPVLYYGMDLHFLREMREFEVTGSPFALAATDRMRPLELELVQKADCALFPSPVETEYLKKLLPSARLAVLPAYIVKDVNETPYTLQGRNGLLFVGNYNHRPNIDAVEWLLEEIMPVVHKSLPEVPVLIAGGNPTENMHALAAQTPGAQVLGHLPEKQLDALYEQCRLCVAPLRYGAGIKGKLISAMEQGLPVVSTSVGTEGIERCERAVAQADTAVDLAKAICQLYNDEAALAKMAKNAYGCLQGQFSQEVAWETLQKAMEA